MSIKNLTPAQFANSIGVQRSGISHILSGRNKPSLDFVLKILESYTDINESWLLLGKGEMLKSNTKSNTEPIPLSVFPSENSDNNIQTDDITDYDTKETPNSDQIEEHQGTFDKIDEPIKKEGKITEEELPAKVVKWVAFYEDNSFKEFYRT